MSNLTPRVWEEICALLNVPYATVLPHAHHGESADAAAALRQALASMPESEWRTIDSAPKDGTPILVWCPEYWANERARDWGKGAIITAVYAVYDEDSDPCWMEFVSNDTEPCTPTHWKPLPEPPTTHKGES